MDVDNITYTSNNSSATHTIAGGVSNGCDSLVALDLTILISATGIDNITNCSAYTWINGLTYTASHTLTGAAFSGCGSIVMLD